MRLLPSYFRVFATWLLGLACVLPSALADPSHTPADMVKYGAVELRPDEDPRYGKGITFKTIESDDHMDKYTYRFGAGKKLVGSQRHPFGVFYRNQRGDRIHAVVSHILTSLPLLIHTRHWSLCVDARSAES